MYSGTAHFSHNCGTKFFIAYIMLHTKLTKKPKIPNYASLHKLSYGIRVSISQSKSSPSKMQCSVTAIFSLTTVNHEKITPPPSCATIGPPLPPPYTPTPSQYIICTPWVPPYHRMYRLVLIFHSISNQPPPNFHR